MNKIESICNLIEEIKNSESQFNNAQVWFRGQKNFSWNLIPSVHRFHSILEAEFANHFRLKAPAVHSACPSYKAYAKWLPFMQHYGLPTRLLDWTESPLIALFFAIENKDFDSDRSIWMLAPGKLNEHYDVSIIPFLSNNILEPIIQNSFNQTKMDTPINFLSVTAPQDDNRMGMQMAHFTIHNVRDALEEHSETDTFLKKYKIPHKCVKNIRQELSILGIRRSKIFPDLTNLGKEIAEIKAIIE